MSHALNKTHFLYSSTHTFSDVFQPIFLFHNSLFRTIFFLSSLSQHFCGCTLEIANISFLKSLIQTSYVLKKVSLIWPRPASNLLWIQGVKIDLQLLILLALTSLALELQRLSATLGFSPWC